MKHNETEENSRKDNVRIGNYKEEKAKVVVDIAKKDDKTFDINKIDNSHRVGKKIILTFDVILHLCDYTLILLSITLGVFLCLYGVVRRF